MDERCIVDRYCVGSTKFVLRDSLSKDFSAGNDNPRGVDAVVVNRVLGFDRLLRELDCLRAASLRIRLVERRSCARDGDADAVPGVEDLADPADIEFKPVDLAGLEKCFVIEAVAIASA